MNANERTLTESPDHFDHARSIPRTVIYLLIAVLFAIGAILSIIFGNQIGDFFSGATGRRSWLGPFMPILIPVVALLFAVPTFREGLQSFRFTRRQTGSVLRTKFRTSGAGDLAAAQQLHARFATKDPAVYTPVPGLARKGTVHQTVWMVPEDRVGYVGISYGKNPNDKAAVRLPLITFAGPDYDQLETARAANLLKKFKG